MNELVITYHHTSRISVFIRPVKITAMPMTQVVSKFMPLIHAKGEEGMKKGEVIISLRGFIISNFLVSVFFILAPERNLQCTRHRLRLDNHTQRVPQASKPMRHR